MYPKLIPTTNGSYILCDANDFEKLSKFFWRELKGYAYRMAGKKMIYLHRQLLNPPKNRDVDHRNRNGLDNRRENLRICTEAQNCGYARKRLFAKPARVTTSKYKGVSWRKDRQRWTAYIGTGKQREILGCFAEEKEAAKAYNAAAVRIYGDFAELNQI